eukprot:CAMPEP_0182421640 /NCGR_PEP_ID=MMETSP1167-20130531/7061_1 /TAXON_ID=2988 /ORGANISM="Mallomonas Sp, Strain CCMP3275" /LENGTH=241 /DNA_ID=CAMNT_0024598945 /DNA_START=77 /DNA_END=799 /DNA_ORIENTATION=+
MATAGINASPISDFRFLNILVGFGLIGDSEVEKATVYAKMSKLDQDAKDAAHGLGLKEFCLSMSNAERACKHRELFYSTLNMRTRDDYLEGFILNADCEGDPIANVVPQFANNIQSDPSALPPIPGSPTLESPGDSLKSFETSSHTMSSEVDSYKPKLDHVYKNVHYKAPTKVAKALKALDADYSQGNFLKLIDSTAKSTNMSGLNRARRTLDAIQDTLGGRMITCAQLSIICEQMIGGSW